jgi:hypothetical protein
LTDLSLDDAAALLNSRREISDETSLRTVADIALTAQRKQAGWGRVRLLALRQLGSFLIEKGAKQGRPAKTSADDVFPTLAKLGITDRHLSADARAVARVSKWDFDKYFEQEGEPTLKGLLRLADHPREVRIRPAGKTVCNAGGSDFADIMFRRRNGRHNDVVYTSPELARRIVDHFRPHFRPGDTFLDLCAGDNAFYDALSEPKDWCEIERGRNFLDWTTRATWGITNPPWSAEAYRPIARHAYELCDNVIFLARWHTATSTYARHRDWIEAGHGWRETVYIPWADAKFIDKHGEEKAEGFILAAFWWSRGWTGGMTSTYWTDDIPEMIAEAAD